MYTASVRIQAWVLVLGLLGPGGLRAGRLTLLHTSTVAGEVDPCGCSDENLGGLDRRVQVVRDLREELPHPVLVVDTGDLLLRSQFMSEGEREHFTRRAEVFARAGERMGLDILALGELDLGLGPDRLRRALPARWILAGNVRVGEERPFPAWRVVEAGGLRVAFLAALADQVTLHPDLGGRVVVDPALPVLREAIQAVRREGVDLVILAGHLGFADLRRLLPALRGVDVALVGHTRELLEEPIMVGGVPVVGAGTRGKYLGRLDLEVDPAARPGPASPLEGAPPGTRVRFRHRILRLGEAYALDPPTHDDVEAYRAASRRGGFPLR